MRPRSSLPSRSSRSRSSRVCDVWPGAKRWGCSMRPGPCALVLLLWCFSLRTFFLLREKGGGWTIFLEFLLGFEDVWKGKGWCFGMFGGLLWPGGGFLFEILGLASLVLSSGVFWGILWPDLSMTVFCGGTKEGSGGWGGWFFSGDFIFLASKRWKLLKQI